ncbi:unnamed protein product, partial [Bubo scandiacus]
MVEACRASWETHGCKNNTTKAKGPGAGGGQGRRRGNLPRWEEAPTLLHGAAGARGIVGSRS